MKTQPHQIPNCFSSLKLFTTLILATLLSVPTLFAASQTWTNAPTDNSWTNVLNWNGKAVPGAVNVTGNTVNGDIAIFTNPIPISGIGGSGAADKGILPDASSNATRAREIAGITFDGATCGAYFIGTNGMTVPPSATAGVLWVSHNGAIRVNPAVANNQTILEPLTVILPSSTAGIYNLVNNSTNGAALIVNFIQHGGATSRATTFILDGTNSANNVVTNLSEGGGNATGGFTKQGTGTWTIAGPSTFPSPSALNINQGTLVVQDAGAFGASTATVNSNAVLLIQNGVNITPASTTTVQRNGTIKVNGSATLNGVTVGTAAAGTTPNLVTTGSGDVLTIGNANNKFTGGAADSTVRISGPGTVLLGFGGFDNNYIGKWSVDAGTLSVASQGTLGTGANINISAGGTLNITNLGAVTWNPTTTGIGGSGTGTTVGSTAGNILADPAAIIDLATGTKAINLTYTPTSFTGDLTHPALFVSQGTLSMGGNAFTINNAGASPLGVGTYRLIQQNSGTITDGGGYSVVGVTGAGVSAGNVASVVVSGGNVNLVIAPYTPKNLVWSGTGSAWDIATTSDWLNGVSSSVFNNSDNVTFNSVGAANPTVTLSGTISPSSVTVNADSPTNYTLTGGQIAGGASLIKKGSGTLTLNQASTYSGGTVISNGVLKAGIANAISSTGAGNVSLVNPGVLDLNAFSVSINGLSGNGTVDTVSGGSPVLTIGNNDASSTFSGVLQNTSGALSLTKVGAGTATLSGANTFSGSTTVSLGTLVLNNPSALGSSALTVSAGGVDVQTNLNLTSLAGSGGAGIATSTGNSVTINVTGSANTTFSGFIWDGAGGGTVSLKILGTTTLTLGGNNTYSGGTYVGSGCTFAIPNGGAPNNANVSGFLVASNLATLSLSGGSATPGTPTNILTVDGATVSFTSGALGKIWGGQFQGSANTTNRILNTMSFGGDSSFKNFNGLVNLEPNAQVRFINIPAGTAGGGDAATFNFVPTSYPTIVTRDAATVRLGEIRGGNSASGIDQATTGGIQDTYILGGKNVSSTFEGFFRGSNNLVKIGSGKLTFDGMGMITNTDGATYTNYLIVPLVTYAGFTTISNGVLAFNAPNNGLTSSNITLAGVGAVLDATASGYAVDVPDGLGNTNSVLVTNAVVYNQPFGVVSGIGTIYGSLSNAAGSTLNPGNTTGNIATGVATGVLNVTNVVDIEGATVNVQLNRTNSIISDEISAGGSIFVNGGVLMVTNVGPDLITGDVLTVFNKGITGSGFTTISLPVSNILNNVQYLYQTNLFTAGSSPAGTIKVIAGASAIANYSTNITATVTGGGTGITIAWPATHLGWELMLQTNSLTTGLANNWVTNYGTANVTATNYPINPANGSVFYRLVHP
jgi:autotransporter-associated beta strand protein